MVVSVDSTRLAGAADFAVLPVLHTMMMDDAKVQQYTLNFLRHGYFISAAERHPIGAGRWRRSERSSGCCRRRCGAAAGRCTTVNRPPGRIAGIDYGTVRVGIAISDPAQSIASPYETYTRRGEPQDAARFRRLVEEEQVAKFVVGLPVHLDGRESGKSVEARRFGAWLAETTGVAVEYFDERFTTHDAELALADAKLTQEEAQGAARQAGRADHAHGLSRITADKRSRRRRVDTGARRVAAKGMQRRAAALLDKPAVAPEVEFRNLSRRHYGEVDFRLRLLGAARGATLARFWRAGVRRHARRRSCPRVRT